MLGTIVVQLPSFSRKIFQFILSLLHWSVADCSPGTMSPLYPLLLPSWLCTASAPTLAHILLWKGGIHSRLSREKKFTLVAARVGWVANIQYGNGVADVVMYEKFPDVGTVCHPPLASLNWKCNISGCHVERNAVCAWHGILLGLQVDPYTRIIMMWFPVRDQG